MFKVGASVVVKGRLCDVMCIGLGGDVLVRDVINLELHWYDYFVVQVLDPNENPGALLEAMSNLRSDEGPNDPSDGQAAPEEG